MNNDDFDIESVNVELEALRDEILKARGKCEDKFWKEVELTLDLVKILNRFTKTEIETIAKNLDINKISSLKKEELIEKVVEFSTERVEKLLNHMDEERFKLLFNITKNGGYMKSDEKMDLDKLIYFKDRALLFPSINDDKYVTVVPEVIQKVIKEKDNINYYAKIKRNEEIIKLFWGMTYYYGIITIEEFKELAKKYVSYDLSDINLEKVLSEGSEYYEDFVFKANYGSHITLTEEETMLKVHEENEDIEYKFIEKEKLMEAAALDYIERNESYDCFFNFLVDNFEMNEEESDLLIDDLIFDIRNNESLEQTVEQFLNNFEFNNDEELNFVVYHVLKLANNTPQWFLKGHTPEELSSSTPVTTIINEEPKIGRNEPCPCGSGKKYKKCCASNVISIK